MPSAEPRDVSPGSWALSRQIPFSLPAIFGFSIFFEFIKAIGFGQIGGNKAVWYAVGEFSGYPIRLYYHYSEETIPHEWEQEGTMILELSQDGNTLSGKAISASGNWSGSLIFKRIK